ncbi:ribonuclease H-like domain-containing protein [Tanacetum coccineum]
MALAISTIEAAYVAAGRACQQALRMKQVIKDYDTHCEDIFVLCDNKEHGASSSHAQQMNPEEQIEFEINSWFEESTWNEAEREISPDEVLGKEVEYNLSFVEGMAFKSYLSTKRQHRESRTKMGVMKKFFVRDNICTVEFDTFSFSVNDFPDTRSGRFSDVIGTVDLTGHIFHIPSPHAFLVKYATRILERAGMVSCNSSMTSVDTESKLGDDGDLVSNLILYRSLSGSLQQIWLLIRMQIGLVALLHRGQLYAEAEYRGVANVVAETCWLRNLLRELHTLLSSTTVTPARKGIGLGSGNLQFGVTKYHPSPR